MLYLVRWTIDPEHSNATISRFKETGGPAPTGVEVLGRWHSITGGGGCAIAESDDLVQVGKWCHEWTDLIHFEITPAVNDEDMMKILTD